MSPEELQDQVSRSEAINRELREQVQKLRKELAEARSLWSKDVGFLVDARERAAAAESALAEARGALLEYGRHRQWCAFLSDDPDKGCNCGFKRATLARAGEQETPAAMDCEDCQSRANEGVDTPCSYHRSAVQEKMPDCAPCSCGKMRVPNGTRGVMDFASIVHRADACVYAGNPATPPPGEQGKGGGEGQAPVSVVCDWYSTPHTRNSVCPNPRPAPAQPAEHPASGGEEEGICEIAKAPHHRKDGCRNWRPFPAPAPGAGEQEEGK